ncbi:MAG: hypothetical protein HDR07_09950 [Lachnospiraceae bacterium]|nr:hypothetical protein [Lachnospiraceae bacterium]
MKLDYATGFYNISFFNINIETEEELTQDVLKKNEATFIHEFIHYLQDLVLPYNIRYSLSNVRWFFNILESAHKIGSINRPFSEWNDESSTLWTQFLRSFGDGRSVAFVSKIGDATSKFVTTSGYDNNLHIQREHRVYEYLLPVFEVGKSTSISYNLGARDILEYIAYKIDLKNFPNRPPVPQLPYESIDLIFDKYGLSNISDDIRLCIAERCLYNDVPIHFLLSALLGNEEFKKYITDSSYDEIYDYLLFSTTITRDGQSETLIAKTQRRLMQFAYELQLQYSGFDEIKNWILKVNNFVEHKLAGRFIFSDLYKMNSDEMFTFINDVIYCIGIPLVMNSRKKCISIHSNDIEVSQFIQFYILQNFIYFVKSQQTKCPIYNFCKANGGICNENCIVNKQMTITGNENCYYRRFLEQHGLFDIKIN